MKLLRYLLALSLLCAVYFTPFRPALSQTSPDHGTPGTAKEAAQRDGMHDFDFQVGEWRVHHRVKRGDTWLEFEGTCVNRPLMAGQGNVEDHTFNRPAGITRAMGFRAYDPKTGLWAIWWVDARDPHLPVDPPVKGRFEHGIGTFYSDSVIGGKTIRTRYVWSQITPTSARWEQAASSDEGKTWDTNWIMQFQRVS